MARTDAPLPLIAPIPAAALNKRRLALRRSLPTEGIGVHRHRRMGQSLEFREYRDYQRGDDARTIDWAASSRMARRVVRTFEAEERRTVFLIVDCRPTMHLPLGAEKITVALWVAQALALAAQAEGDRVILTTLFGPRDGAPISLRSGRAQAEVRALGEVLRHAAPRNDSAWRSSSALKFGAIARMFDPASAVVLLTDALFSAEDRNLIRLAQAAQRSYRSLHVVELDAWPMERQLLSEGAFRLGAIGERGGGEALLEATEAQLASVDRRLDAHRHAVRKAFRGPGLVWPDRPISWPEEARPGRQRVESWFRGAFLTADILPSLLSRAS